MMVPHLQCMAFAVAFSGLIISTLVGTSTEAQAGQAHFQARNMYRLPDPTDLVAGAATLTRITKGISFRIYTSELLPGAHPVWIVIFNRPEKCAGGSGGCGPADLGNPEVQPSIVYGAGYIVGADGIANFQGSLEKGRPPVGLQVNVPAGLANGLKDAMKAEIHLIVRTHGPTDDMGGAVDQLTTFEDDCAACADVQAAIVFEAVK